eukprot:gene56935-biopygen15688
MGSSSQLRSTRSATLHGVTAGGGRRTNANAPPRPCRAGRGLQDGDGAEYVGTMKSFSQDSGYGFIVCEELHRHFGWDVWAHWRQVPRNCERAGTRVAFRYCFGKRGQQARGAHKRRRCSKLRWISGPNLRGSPQKQRRELCCEIGMKRPCQLNCCNWATAPASDLGQPSPLPVLEHSFRIHSWAPRTRCPPPGKDNKPQARSVRLASPGRRPGRQHDTDPALRGAAPAQQQPQQWQGWLFKSGYFPCYTQR